MNREMAVIVSVLEAIKDTGLERGQRLPDERSQVRELGVSRTTLRRAMSRLKDNGIVERRQGSGTYLVRKPNTSEIHEILNSRQGNGNNKVTQTVPLRRRIVSQKTYRLAFFHDQNPDEPRFKDTLSAACGYAHKKGHELLVGASRPTRGSVVHRDFTDSVYRPDADGIILSATLRAHDIPNLKRIPVPYVLYIPIASIDGVANPINNVISLDLPSACCHAVGELARLGHRRIVILEKLCSNHKSQIEHVAHFLKKDLSAAAQVDFFAGQDPYSEIAKLQEAPTALFVSDDKYCAGICEKAGGNGRAIGKDISVISVALRGITTGLRPEIGRMEFDMKEVGRLLVQQVERLIDDERTSFAPIRIGAEYIPGTQY
ncbi:MAG: GntR family transcriptional regulator [Planctomycetota bacterium]